MAYFAFGGTNLQKGAQGDTVRKIQTALNEKGYNLTVDGIWGDKTDAAVRDFQGKNSLTVDGIYGTNTHTALFGSANTPVSAPTIKPAPTAPKYDTTSWDDTTKGKGASDAYDDAKEAVNKYGPFQYGNMEQYNAVMDKILNREKFSYDFNGDALYQQYKDKYIKQGKMAMGDAIGQASAMTGGYGNSYAQSVGQQAYQAQLENLNDVIPELYSMALDKYNMEGQELYDQFGMLGADYDRAYGEHKDGYNKLMDALGIARGDYYDGADMFHTEQSNKNNVLGKEFDDAMSIYNAENDNAWKQAAWDEDARRFEIDQGWKAKEDARAEKEYNAKYGTSSSGGSTGGSSGGSSGSGNNGSGGGNTYNNAGYSDDIVKKAQAFIGVSADGKWGPNSTSAAKAKGYNSLADVVKAMGGGNNPAPTGFTGSTYNDAYDYAVKNGVPKAHAAGIMTASEWNRRKSSYQAHGTGGTEVKNYSSYKDYLADITAYLVEKYN